MIKELLSNIGYKLAFALMILSLALLTLSIDGVYAFTCTWTGVTDTDWFNAANWSGCNGTSPQATDTVVIPDVTNDPLLNGDAAISDLTINSGGVLSIGANILTLNGGVTNNGTLNGNTGTVILAGSSNRTLSGTGTYDLYNLTVNLSGVYVNLSSNVTLHIAGNFTKTAGSFRCNSVNNASANSCTLDFDGGGSSLFSWSTSSILPWNITVQPGTTVNIGATNNSFTLRGDLGGEGTLIASGGTITFETVTTSNLAGAKTLNNLVVNSPTQLLLAVNASFSYKGAFTLNGTFDAITNSPTTLILAGTSSQTLPSDITTLHNLTINNASGVNLSANETVNDVLTFISGRIATGANTLILGSSGTVTGAGAGNYVYGNFQKAVTTGNPTINFEIGGASSYAPASVTFNNVTASGTLTGSTTDGPHPDFSNSGLDGSNYINRYWTLTQSGLAFTSYDAAFNFVAGDYVGSPTPESTIVRKFDAGTWTHAALTTATATSASANGFTSFSSFAIGNDTTTTPVTLSYFKAERYGDSVHFNWSTATESGNIGFNLYALDGAQLIRLNEELIPSQKIDSLGRLDYSFRANTGGDAFYIEDVNLLGQADSHGPFEAGLEYGSRMDENKIDWNAIHIESRSSQQVRQEALKPDLSTAPVNSTSLTLKVRESGLYRVTYEMLRNAGLDLLGVASNRITLTNRGQEQPIYMQAGKTFGSGSFIEFYGQALDTIYTDTNVYTLQISRRPIGRIPLINGQPGKSQNSSITYNETLMVNNQRAYASYAPGNDAWYDTEMLTFTTSKSWEFPFQINELANSLSATLELTVWGVTDWPQDSDHHLKVSVNGIPLADEIFDGLVEKKMKLNLPVGALHEGLNNLQLTLPGDTGAEAELVALDKFSVTYPRAFMAQNGRLTFTATGENFKVTNLPGKEVIVYRMDKHGLARLEKIRVQGSGNTFTATFAGTSKPATYLVTTTEAMYAPTFEAASRRGNLNRTAEYLIISHPDFMEGIQPLAAAHQAQGMTVSVVNVNDLYTQYSYGVFDPQAIQKYIAYAVKNLGTQYVLLVGGDTYDYRNYLGVNSISFIPSLYAKTGPIANFVPSDTLYADMDQDNVPDLAIGRFPVRNINELNLMVNKTLAYADKNYGQTSVFASDLQDGAISFKAISDRLASEVPSDWMKENIHLDDLSVSSARSQLLAAMNRGTALVTFTGHSGPQEWTFSNLFNIGNAVSLTNAGKPFVVVQWGCWNTYYVDPIYNYLVQSFLLSGDRGAAAVLGATTLADSNSEQLLGQLLTPRLTQPGMTLGQALLLSKSDLARTHPGLLDVMLGWSLMGDPALVIAP